MSSTLVHYSHTLPEVTQQNGTLTGHTGIHAVSLRNAVILKVNAISLSNYTPLTQLHTQPHVYMNA